SDGFGGIVLGPAAAYEYRLLPPGPRPQFFGEVRRKRRDKQDQGNHSRLFGYPAARAEHVQKLHHGGDRSIVRELSEIISALLDGRVELLLDRRVDRAVL